MQKSKAILTVRLDRIKVAADYLPRESFANLDGFRRVYDYSMMRSSRNGSRRTGFGRVCRFVNEKTGTQIEGEYQPLQPWFPACTVTLVANDRTGLIRREVDVVLRLLEGIRLMLVEIALDFDAGSVIDGNFVRRHLIVGKCHYQRNWGTGFEYFGTRKSAKFARCYKKRAINAYRVELEFHTAWLRKHKIKTIANLVQLPDLLPRKELRFVRLDVNALRRQLHQAKVPVEAEIQRARDTSGGLYFTMLRLRQRLGLRNTHRLLINLKTNARVEKALRIWAEKWQREGD